MGAFAGVALWRGMSGCVGQLKAILPSSPAIVHFKPALAYLYRSPAPGSLNTLAFAFVSVMTHANAETEI